MQNNSKIVNDKSNSSSIGGLPVLNLVPSNISEFRRRAEIFIPGNYGIMGTFIRTQVKYVPPYLAIQVTQTHYNQLVENRNKEIEEYRNKHKNDAELLKRIPLPIDNREYEPQLKKTARSFMLRRSKSEPS